MAAKAQAPKETDNLKMLRDLHAQVHEELPLLVAVPDTHPNDRHPGGKSGSEPPPG